MNITIHNNITITPKGNKNAFKGVVKPLRQVYRTNDKGLPVGKFNEVTGLDTNELYRKLIPLKYLTLVKVHSKVYILNDVYWQSLLTYLRRTKEIMEPQYITLKKSKLA